SKAELMPIIVGKILHYLSQNISLNIVSLPFSQ
ncbi:MAG: hypothetical protein ACI9CD_000642, partial [Candidatus Deianiraeaceae bacterium]